MLIQAGSIPRTFMNIWRRPREIFGRPDAKYELLEDTLLPEFDLKAVESELLADEWTQSGNVLMKVLTDYGARGMTVAPWVGRTRNMTFNIRTGIPWSKVFMYQRLSPDSVERVGESDPELHQGMTKVVGTHEVTGSSANTLSVESRYYCLLPFGQTVDMRMALTLKPQLHGKRHDVGDVVLRVGGFVDAGYSGGFVERMMEQGFMQAVRTYGKALRADLEQRVPKNRAVL